MVGVDRDLSLVAAGEPVVDLLGIRREDSGVGLGVEHQGRAGDPGQVGAARVWATRRLHMPSQPRSVQAAAMPCAERFAFTGVPA